MPKPISKTTLFTPSDAPFILDPSKPVLTHTRDMQAETGIEPHSHPRSQLLWAAKGVLRVRSDTAVWVVPSTHAVWIPSGLPHQVVCETLAHTRNLYIDPSFIVRAQDEKVVMVSMSSLMREIILRLTENVQPHRPEPLHRLGLVAIDELERLASVDTHLPAGSDPRLSRVIQRLIREPQANFSLAELAEIGGASIRTIERLFKSETGLTYRQWRQRFRLLNALEKLHQGGSTTAVAHDLGYLSVSSFSSAFKAEFGRTPQEYASHRTLNSTCSKTLL